MTPALLLSLWRQRWGKPDAVDMAVEHEQGGLHDWAEKSVQSTALDRKPVWLSAMVLFVCIAILLSTLSFSLTMQWVLSGLILLLTLLVRRYRSEVITLLMLGLALITTTRYLVWRAQFTLVAEWDLEMLTVLSFFVLELLGIAWYAANLFRENWPIQTELAALPLDTASWPKVSVFVMVPQGDAAAAQLSLDTIANWQWPNSKLSITLLDVDNATAVRDLALSRRIRWLTYSDDADKQGSILNRAIAENGDECSLVVLAGDTPDEATAAAAVSALHEQITLGLICTPGHDWMPPVPAALHNRVLPRGDHTRLLALRRSLFMQVGGFSENANDQGQGLLQSFDRHSVHHAWVQIDDDGLGIGLQMPWHSRSLQRRLKIHRITAMLDFYRPLWLLALWLAPLFYLLLGRTFIHADASTWLAMGLPHALQALLLSNRLQHARRLRTLMEWREWWLRLYLLVLTFFTANWTMLQQMRRLGWRTIWLHQRRPWRTWLGWAWNWAHLLAMLAGAWQISHTTDQGVKVNLVFYMIWSAYLLLLGVARFALEQEALAVLRHQQQLHRLPAMLKLANGKTLACQTVNFPQLPVQLQLPTTLVEGQAVLLTILHPSHELTLQAKILPGKTSLAQLMPSDPLAYTDYARSLLVRPQNWPHWLPGQTVDQIVPATILGALAWPLNRLSQLLVFLDQRSRRQRSTTGKTI